MSNYYYLIAGLADFSPEDQKAPYSFNGFREEVYDQLSQKDRKLMDLFCYEYDCANLLKLLKAKNQSDENAELDERGLFSADKLQALIAQVRGDEQPDKCFPSFMTQFVKEYVSDEWNSYSMFAEDRIYSLYFEYAMNQGNPFVESWFSFRLDLNNIRTAFTARKHNLDIQALIVGSGETAAALRTSGARDWGLSQTLPYFDRIARIQEETDLTVRERKTDMLQWEWLEENTFFNYFSIERLLSYLLRLGIVERWTRLDSAEGQKFFRAMIDDLKSQVEIPAEFRNN